MSDITLRNRKIYDANIGAVICRTPKTLNDELIDDVLVDRHCMLINNVDDFVKYFGDPYINPTEYSDAIVALDLINHNVRMYISSVYEMQDNKDGFDVPYNGYTEFYFLDSEKHRTVGYKLKSDLKFCQPIIQSECSLNVLTLYVSLFLLDRSVPKTDINSNTIYYTDEYGTAQIVDEQGIGVKKFDPSHGTINTFDPSLLYTIYKLEFDISKVKTVDKDGNVIESPRVTDKDLIEEFSKYGLELKPVNTYGETDLIDKFISYTKFSVVEDQTKYPEYVYDVDSEGKHITDSTGKLKKSFTGKTGLDYEYDLHTDNYNFDFSDDNKLVEAYQDAIERLRDCRPEPLFASLGRLYKSFTVISDVENESDTPYIVRSVMCDLDPYNYSVVHYHLLNAFDPAGTSINMETLSEEYSNASNTYLFISAPDIPVTSVNKWLAASDEFDHVVERPEQYNCDMFYGYITEFAQSSLYYQHPHRTLMSAAILAMYNALLNSAVYMTNMITNLNIANASVKTFISESSAKKLADNRCNSAVLFDTGSPSIYGDRSLSMLPNLRYSHISRNFILIRRLICDYLETKKFILNTVYETDICVNYITTNILEQFKINGTLKHYTIEKSSSRQTVLLTITLYFMQMAGNLKLDFTI